MISSSVTAFERLASRPPTPPKEHDTDIDDAIRFLNADFSLDQPTNDQEGLPSSSTHTPTHEPSSPPLSFENGTKDRQIKRVEFSPCVTAHKPIQFGTPTNGNALLKRLHSNKDLKPLRSILKSTPLQGTPTPDATASPTPDCFSSSDPTSFSAMLESVVKLLAASSPALRLDGYRTLNGALKAYSDLPGHDALKAKMTLLTQFMARDIAGGPSGKTDLNDANLTTQALKLATAILLIPILHGSFNDDFQNLLVDKSIEIIAREDVSKTIANHHMYLLASQTFSSKVMTATKAEQIVASLSTIQNRVSGNSVIGARLVIYQRLMEQAPTVMLATIREWLPHIFHGSLSSIKDVRVRAIETGLHAGLILGANSQATKAIIDLFSTSTNESTTYGDYLTARLSDMVNQKDLATHVPQIWSMVILFFRSKKTRITRWGLFKKAWLLIIQKCMNSSDIQVRYRANLAWNKLIFVISPDQETMNSMDGMVKMLKIPFVAAFEKKDRDKHGKEARQLAVSGYCHLLHYALRPSQSYDELDIYWDEYVHQVLSKLFRSGSKDVSLATRILSALFNGTSKVWNANLANEPTTLTPEELPRLDPKWVRSRAQRILDLTGPHFSSVLSSSEQVSSIDKTCWRDFLTAISEAGSQEVRASVELRDTLAQLMNFFGRLWKEASKNFKEQADGAWITRFGDLVRFTIEKLGAVHFSEANLLQNEMETFEAAPTPSHRPSKHHMVLLSPMVFLFSLFARPPAAVSADTIFFQVAKDLVHDICQAKISRRSRLHLLRQCSETIGRADIAPATQADHWSVIAQEFAASLADSDSDQTVQEPQRLGNQLRDAVHVLSIGFRHCSVSPNCISSWESLYTNATKLLRKEGGEGAVVLGLVEPTAEALSNMANALHESTIIQLTTTLFGNSTWPKNRQQMEEGRKALWNTGLASTRHSIFEPFVHLFSLADVALKESYDSIKECEIHLPFFIQALESFLQSSPGPQLHTTLRKMQQGLASFIGDQECLITPSREGSRLLTIKIVSLWQTILRLLKALPSSETLLKALDILFAAGLNSSHRSIVNDTVTFWNDTFGQLESISYPPNVEHALRRIRPLVELELPTFPVSTDDQPSPLKDFVESQEIAELDSVETPSRTRPKSPGFKLKGHGAISAVRGTPTRIVQPSERHGSSTPRQGRVTRAKAKLRHEDSQIEFTAVESSSPPGTELESQLLTEHQQEVNSRQKYETAQMYPDFSSSPAPRTSSGKPRMPRLDFSAQKIVPEDYTTPTLFSEENEDDYLGSSPTPKAAEKAQSRGVSGLREETRPSEDLEDSEDDDIPSSPPSMSDNMDVDGAEAAEIQNAHPGVANAEHPIAQFAKTDQAECQANQEDDETENDDELLQDEEASEEAESVQVGVPEPEEDNTATSSHYESNDFVEAPMEMLDGGKSAEEGEQDVFTDSLNDQDTAEAVDGVVLDNADQQDEMNTGTSKIEDSFRESTPKTLNVQSTPVKDNGQLHENTQESQSGMQTRSKRKRSTDAGISTPTKHHKASPLKRMLSWVTGSQDREVEEDEDEVAGDEQDEDGEDEEEMRDCIFVASQPERVVVSSTETPSLSASAPASVEAPASKKRRGRPRKSQTPISSTPAQPAKLRLLKRNSSVLSTRSDGSADSHNAGPRKSRRLTRSQDATMMPVVEVEVPRTASRAVGRATFSSIQSNAEDDESSGEGTDQGADSQLKLEDQAACSRDRVIAKPKSIMERLRSILSDCKTMVLGSQEERDMDDVLFEMRKEVHEAGRRGRE